MIEGPDHDAVDIAGQYPGGILDRLPPSQLDVTGGKEERVPAELEGADLEGDSGAGRALGEDHGQRLAGERLLPIVAALHAGGQIENGEELGFGEVRNREEMAGRIHRPGGIV